ncbi:hypothetical protein SISSUDRAFT_970170, partial [Sistotremastrum suecicum HHB10207 ss-3]
ITASANFPLTWTENPEVMAFFAKFIPHAEAMMKHSKVTLQCDGWTGENHHHLQAFMVTGDNRLQTVKLYDTSNERHTAENLLAQMQEVVEILRKDWHVTVIAVTSDASGESKKARQMLGRLRPDLAVPDCYAHQARLESLTDINLIVGDYFKTVTTFLKHANSANELISWLRSKNQILGLIREECKRNGRAPLGVIRPVPTRWTAFHLAYKRLLTLRKLLINIINADSLKHRDERQVIQGTAAGKKKAREMVALMKDATFWVSLTRINHHLTPLAIAANSTQSTFCRLDDVIMTLGALFGQYQAMKDPADLVLVKSIHDSIDKRWAASDQDIFVACALLNPFIRTTPFAKGPLFTTASIFTLLARLWRRFF